MKRGERTWEILKIYKLWQQSGLYGFDNDDSLWETAVMQAPVMEIQTKSKSV